MSQFASMAYPQKNPANPILLEFRSVHAGTGNDLWSDAVMFSSDLIEENSRHDAEHWSHAMSVLTRFLAARKRAALTG
ncbi:hypothetical protein [Microbacterium sp. KSW4-4]|uniref:hypothetical protein n=1 Tax=Microbacterium sp. KSW4-4 TaxID=2851651 RepID=UPI001FFD5D06|nr:hypothetical protein [Microbacterium sp. KSW4-4]MCK2034450.1 hypothetical protein [Microbacterium sp. KSW4-4]